MNLFRRKDSSGRKKPLLRREAAGSEHERILLDEAQAHGKQPRGHSFRPRGGFLNFLGGWHRRHRNKEPEDVIHLTETSKGMGVVLECGRRCASSSFAHSLCPSFTTSCSPPSYVSLAGPGGSGAGLLQVTTCPAAAVTGPGR